MKHKALYLYLILFFLLCCSVTTTGQEKKQERFTLMGLGDSITEGADFFTCYLYPLWEKLFTAGYQFDFIGPRESKCRIGTRSEEHTSELQSRPHISYADFCLKKKKKSFFFFFFSN